MKIVPAVKRSGNSAVLPRLVILLLVAAHAASALIPPTVAAAAPQVVAEQWIIMDARSGTVLAARDPETPRAIASLTKVMTAVVAIERGHLDMPVAITEGDKVGEATAGLLVGDTVTVETLLHALLLPSGNDAAMALARAVGGSALYESDGARAQFVSWMNEKAEVLGLSQTHFVNPHGLDEPGHHSSAYDLALLTRYAISLPDFRRIFGAAEYSGEGYYWQHGNQLPTMIDGVSGGKTGWTDGCGRCLIEVVEVADGREAIIVLLGSNLHRYDDAVILTRYARDLPPPADDPARAGAVFQRLWDRTDSLVATNATARSWLWGSPLGDVVAHQSAGSGSGPRYDRLYEKGRMEINHPHSRMDSGWYVTPALLAVELIEGRADIPLAGDVGVSAATTYADLAGVRWPAIAPGDPVTLWLSFGGHPVDRPGFSAFGVTAGSYYPETGLHTASVFAEFLAQIGPVLDGTEVIDGALFDPPLYATGFPITPPFWITAHENSRYVDVLVQCFQRRCLTYTPTHEPAWQVEMSNIGAHYLLWQEQSAASTSVGGPFGAGSVRGVARKPW